MTDRFPPPATATATATARLMAGLLMAAASAAALAQAAPRPAATPAPAQAPAQSSAQTMVNLRDADIRAFINDVSKVTGTGFVIDNRVQGKVSVVSERPLSRQAYFELFLATLRANGYVAVPLGGGQYRIQPAEAGAGAGSSAGTRFATAVIALDNIDAQAAAESLRPILSRSGTVAANRSGRAVIITDFADNIARARAALAEIDRDTSEANVVVLRNIGARELAQALQQLARQGTGGEGGRRPAAVVPIDSANAIAIKGEPREAARLAQISRELDREASGGADVRVIFLQHADAAAVLPVLQQLMGQTPTTTGGTALTQGLAGTPFGGGNRQGRQQGEAQPAPPPQIAGNTGGNVGVASGPPSRQAIIARYEGANAIIISAPTEVQRKLGEVVRQLDTRRAQVQVEAIIVEISDTAAQQLGVQFLLAGNNGSAVPIVSSNFTNAGPNLLAIAGAIAAERGVIPEGAAADAFRDAAVNSLIGLSGGTAGIGSIGSDLIFGAVISAVRRDGASNILSTPSILTLDNQPARILVGQEIPVTTGEALGQNLDNSFRTVERQDVGIQLSVRPQINAGGTITLAIKQIVSSIAQVVADRDFVLNKRELETAVTVGDGAILALGGLLEDNERRSLQKVPFLGDIPILGELFRSRDFQRSKTNLMIFIRPTIVKDQAGADALTAGRWNSVRTDQAARTGISSLDALAYDYLRTLPPYQPAPFPPPPADAVGVVPAAEPPR